LETNYFDSTQEHAKMSTIQVSKTPTRAGSQKSLETIYLDLKLKTQEHAEMSTIQVLKLITGPGSKTSLKTTA
jgi:hypothetical protein